MKIKVEVTAIFEATQELVDDIGRSEIIRHIKEDTKKYLNNRNNALSFPDNTKVIAYEVR